MMQLIVLGYVPGTNIQITFGFIAQICAVIALIYLVHLLIKEQKYLRNEQITSIEAKTI
jgi:hypothetical protein